MYRRSTGKSADKTDGISNAIDQKTLSRHGQSDVVLLNGHGKRILGGGDDRTSNKDFSIYYAVRLV